MEGYQRGWRSRRLFTYLYTCEPLTSRFSLSAGMVSKVKEFIGDREVLYNEVLNHVINMAQRIGISCSNYFFFAVNCSMHSISKYLSRNVEFLLVIQIGIVFVVFPHRLLAKSQQLEFENILI